MRRLIPLLLVLVMFTAACDMTGLTVTTSADSPVVSSFGADPPTIAAGESSTLSWIVVGATTVSIDQGIGNVALTGRRAVMPSATTVYTLKATNAAGMSATATAQVIVSGAPSISAVLPSVNYFTANPSSIIAGSSAILSWDVSNATSITINPGVGTFASSGTTMVSPAASTTYTLTATNAAGTTTAMTQVTVSGTPSPFTGLPVVNYFTANPPIISAGSSTTLSWDVSNATSVTIDNGVGNVGSTGTVSVSPAMSINYTLTASNASGWYSLTISVMVSAPSPLPDLTITTGNPTLAPSTVVPGGSVSLSGWTVKNQGTAASGSFSNGFYLSTDPVITAGDVYITGNSNSGLAPGAQFNWGGPTLTIPAGTLPGSYYIGILVDRTNAVGESNENNNYVASPITVSTP